MGCVFYDILFFGNFFVDNVFVGNVCAKCSPLAALFASKPTKMGKWRQTAETTGPQEKLSA